MNVASTIVNELSNRCSRFIGLKKHLLTAYIDLMRIYRVDI